MPKKLRIPSLCHHKASHRAVVTIRGRDYYCGPWGSPEASSRYQELIAQHLAGKLEPQSTANEVPPSDVTVVELIDGYWQHCESYYRKGDKPTSEQLIIKRVLRSLKQHFGLTAANDFGPLRLKSFREILMSEADLSRSTINHYVAKVVMLFRWATEHELVPLDRYHGLRSVAGLRAGRSQAREAEPVRPVSAEVVEKTLPYLSAIARDMIRFQRLTGARPSEVCTIRPMDIDRTEAIWQYVPASHKTEHHNKRRMIFIGPRGQQLLLPYLLRAADAYCFSPRDSEVNRREEQHGKRQTPISCGNSPGTNKKPHPKRTPGSRYTHDSYRKFVHRAAKLAGVEQWSPNQLRHSVATEVRKNFGIESASAVLGHATLSTTEIYAEKNSDLARDAMAKLG